MRHAKEQCACVVVIKCRLWPNGSSNCGLVSEFVIFHGTPNLWLLNGRSEHDIKKVAADHRLEHSTKPV